MCANFSEIMESNFQRYAHFFDTGNEMDDEGMHFSAIVNYNKALIFADYPFQESMCYHARSSIYLKIGFFKHCLHSIDLAVENCPPSGVQHLHNNRRKCLKLMKTQPDKGMDAFEHKFNLSYASNPKLPFFIDALKLHEDAKLGKCVITTKDLKAGDVVAALGNSWNAPSFNIMLDQKMMACYTCFNSNNGDLIRGECGGNYLIIKGFFSLNFSMFLLSLVLQ